jgi:beta-phosphoglucomutase-like phosphatase (HAD superfamily)
MIREAEYRNEFDIEFPPGFVVFCDMDGTLVDTDYANYLSYRKAVLEATHGMHDVQRSTERLNRKSLKKQLPSLTDAEYEQIARLKAENFTEFLSQTRVNSSLVNSIRKYSGTNKTVLVTCCREKRALETLRHHKLLECFTRLICWEALPQGGSLNKYESALSLMGASPEAVLVFENDIADVEKAVLAGVPRRNVISVFATV